MVIEKLNRYHKKENFDCGNLFLNDFIKKYAYQNQSRYLVGVTYVVHINSEIIGYITLSAASIKKVFLNSKKPYEDIPILRIGRLSIDKKYQNSGLGKKLLKFAFHKALKLKEDFGCVGIVVDAKEEAVKFYEQFGFIKINTVKKHLTTPMFLSIKVFE